MGENMAEADPNVAIDKGLKAKTGKGLADWVTVARKAPVNGHMAVVSWLKATHALGHGHANSVVHALNASSASAMDEDDLAAAMFAGPKAAMKPVHEAVLAALKSLGRDVELAPKKGYVSFRRNKQFALGQPSTKDRYDLGLVLKGTVPGGRLEAAGSWNAMMTHRVRLCAPKDVDAQVRKWLRLAYEAA